MTSKSEVRKGFAKTSIESYESLVSLMSFVSFVYCVRWRVRPPATLSLR